jgi:hypothetical protein
MMIFRATAAPHDISPDLQHTLSCMVDVLKKTPGISYANWGTSNDKEGRIHVYVEYRAEEGARWTTPTRIDTEVAPHRPYYFSGILPGVCAINDKKCPDTHVTNVAIKRLESHCHAQIMMFMG